MPTKRSQVSTSFRHAVFGSSGLARKISIRSTFWSRRSYASTTERRYSLRSISVELRNVFMVTASVSYGDFFDRDPRSAKSLKFFRLSIHSDLVKQVMLSVLFKLSALHIL